MAHPRTYGELNQHIETKERELREFRDLRVGQLETLLEERDQLLLESSKRFEKLKDDFEYNLTLIHARDIEIERLEHEIRVINGECDQFRNEIKDLTHQIEASQLRETELQKKSELERSNNKRLFDELKDGLQQMHWATEEDARSHAREVDSLKGDIRRLNALRDESLESQRRDLTQTFETLLQQREEGFARKEHEIASQVSILETRFEALQTENTRLKNEVSGAQRKKEAISEELTVKEEVIRKLQWTLEDERAEKHQSDNMNAHKLQQVTIELSMQKENASRDLADLKNKLATAKEEAAREKEFRVALEQRTEELRSAAHNDLSTLENEIAEARNLIGRQQVQIAALRDERDTVLQNSLGVKVELDGLELRMSTVRADHESAVEELQACRARLQNSESQLARLKREYEDYRCISGEKESGTVQQLTDQLIESQEEHFREVTQLRKAHSEEINRLKKEHEDMVLNKSGELSKRQEEDILLLQKRIADKESELSISKGTISSLTAELEEQRRECSALKLRFSVHEAQAQKLQQQVKDLEKQLRQAGSFSSMLNDQPQAHASKDYEYSPDSSLRDPTGGGGAGLGGTTSVDYPPSPMFSEDLGPVSMSFPNSPMTSFAPHSGYGFGFGHPGAGVHRSAEDNLSRKNKEDTFGGVWDERDRKQLTAEEQSQADALAQENERLKRMVKEMRSEVEQLHSELELNRSGTQSPERDPQQHYDSDSDGNKNNRRKSEEASHGAGSSMDLADREKFGILETRLQQTMEEVRRLRQERYSVMDAGNKLRSALSKHVEHTDTLPDEALASELLSEVDHVQDWLESAHGHHATQADAAPYEFSQEFDEYYRGNAYALQNSERYRREQEELQYRRRQEREQEELRNRSRGRTGSRTGMSTRALLGEGVSHHHAPQANYCDEGDTSDGYEREEQGGDDGYSSSGYRHQQHHNFHNHHQETGIATRGGGRSEVSGSSAGRRVWGSPGRPDRPDSRHRNGNGERSKKSPRVDAAAAAAAAGQTISQARTGGQSSGIPMKQSARQDMKLQGHSVSNNAPSSKPTTNSASATSQTSPSLDATVDALGFGASGVSMSAAGNLLATAGSLLPRNNSSRMTPSQQDALRRIQESKRRNSVHVGMVVKGNGAAHNNTTNNNGAGGGARKVMNYAKFVDSI